MYACLRNRLPVMNGRSAQRDLSSAALSAAPSLLCDHVCPFVRSYCWGRCSGYRPPLFSLPTPLLNRTVSFVVAAGEFPMDCPLEDSTLRVHVKGSLPDRTVFWDTRAGVGGGESAPLPEVAGEPYEFATGEGLVRFFD